LLRFIRRAASTTVVIDGAAIGGRPVTMERNERMGMTSSSEPSAGREAPRTPSGYSANRGAQGG
jgi:hypothetical protein